MPIIKVAVIGYGLSATVFHLPFISHLDQYSLVAVSSSQADLVRSQHPSAAIYADAQRMIEESDADLIIITSPNDSHFQLAQWALLADKHVLLEKPMTQTSEQALTLAKLADARSLILSVYQNRRWDGDFLTLRSLIESDDLGAIRVFKSNFDRFRPQVRDRWRERPGLATGILYDLGSHLIDQALCLFGAPLALSARCAMLRDNSVAIDYFQLILHYAEREVVLESSPFSASPNIRFQLQGTQGSYIKYGLDPQEQQLIEGLSPINPLFGIEPASLHGKLYRVDKNQQPDQGLAIATQSGCYLAFYNQLSEAITLNTAVPVSALEAAKVIKIIELAMHSSHTGQCVKVDLSDFNAA